MEKIWPAPIIRDMGSIGLWTGSHGAESVFRNNVRKTRSKKDCLYFVDGNCSALEDVCHGMRGCKRFTENVTEERKTLFRCPFCGMGMRKKRLRSHYIKCRGIGNADSSKAVRNVFEEYSLTRGIGWWRCPCCARDIRGTKERLLNHLRGRCPLSPLNAGCAFPAMDRERLRQRLAELYGGQLDDSDFAFISGS